MNWSREFSQDNRRKKSDNRQWKGDIRHKMYTSNKQGGFTTLIILLLLLLTIHDARAYLCQHLRPQNCTKIECSPAGYILECPELSKQNNDFDLQLSVKTHESAGFDCKNRNVNYEWLKGISLDKVEAVNVRNCPLPNKPVHAFLSQFKVTKLKKLTIDNSLNNYSINNEYFDNMENLTHLIMPRNGLSELPMKLFEKMTQLTNLDLQQNNLNLRNDPLAPLINLKKLELGANDIQYLTPGLLKNQNQLDFLNLWGNKLTNLTKDGFNGLGNLNSLDISSNQISYLPANTFNTLKDLKVLSFFKNNLTYLPEGIFSENKNLQQVKLQNNARLQQLPKGLFANLSSLYEINLSKCNITFLPKDILWGSFNITKIDISRNSIDTLPELLFQDAKNLELLDISMNRITALPGNVFRSLNGLEILHLENNQLMYINEELFHTLHNLKSLYLNNNKLQDVHMYAFEEMVNLENLNLSHNMLTFQPQYKFSHDISSPLQKCTNLQNLDLSFNNINEIFEDWLWVLMKLKKLDLSYNNLTQIVAHDLQFLSPSIQVDLQNNKIATINIDYLELISSQNRDYDMATQVPSVKFSGNELLCDCNLYNLLRYQERKMHQSVYKTLNLNIQGLSCRGPPSLSGLQLTQLNSQTFTCSISVMQECPKRCHCQYWPAEKQYIVNCTGAGFSEISQDLIYSLMKLNLPFSLVLNNNSLSSLTEKSSLRNLNITRLSLSHNHISWIDDSVIPATLQHLKLDGNDMKHFNSSFLDSITNKTNVTLHNNPWSCGCDSVDFLSFLQANYKQVEYLNNITCDDGRILAQLTSEDACPFGRMIIIAASTTIAIVGIIIGILAALYFRYQNEVKVWLYAHNMCLWFVREEELDKDKIFDAFISYSHQDEDFVTDKLLPNLENGSPSYKICVHYRDWIVGEFITTQIARSVEDSKRTIVILSQNFIKSEWGRLEFRAAHKQALAEKRARVIVVIYGELGPLDNLDCELRTYLSTNTYVKWGDPWFWDKLRYALPHQDPPPQRRNGIEKLELINSSATTKATTPPADITNNPLQMMNNFSTKKINMLNELNSFTNKSFANN